MKKKGLIISTVVMVVVLIASLTTATYAWFTASTVTSLNGFDVSVVSSNAVTIGVKSGYTYAPSEKTSGVSPDAFYTGTATFTPVTAGSIAAPGSWSSESTGLSATLDPQINWGAQSGAVGVTSQAVDETNGANLTDTQVTVWPNGASATGTVVTGNKDGANVKVNRATPNGTADGAKGDYVHFILGVSPTRNLSTNNFVLVIEPSTTTSSLGVLASLHVAYRITKYKGDTGNWTDVDIYGTSNSGNTLKANVKASSGAGELVEGALLKSYQDTYGATSAVPDGSIAYQIKNLDLNQNDISQLELVIYMAGSDHDCNDQGKTASGQIKMFFNTADAVTNASAATLNSANKITVTGDNTMTNDNTTVKVRVGESGAFETVGGNWSNGTFTSTKEYAKDVESGTKIYVQVQTTGKGVKDFTITKA